MGCFNETCALSGYPIRYENPIRLLFIVENPVEGSKVADRGLYSTAQWFPRTPPIRGKYNDYGRADFDTNSFVVRVIEEVFKKDLIEKPFGFNECHDIDVTIGKGINHYCECAFEGRLEVRSVTGRQFYHPPRPSFPTWKSVQKLLEKAKLQIMSDNESHNGFNALELMYGIVVVTYNSYDDKELKQQLSLAEAAIGSKFAVKMVYERHGRKKEDPCLIVTKKGAFDDPSVLAERYLSEVAQTLKTKPSYMNDQEKIGLGVLQVMIREDVWQTYLALGDVDQWVERIQQAKKSTMRIAGHDADFSEVTLSQLMRFDDVYQTALSRHIVTASGMDAPDSDQEGLIRACAELLTVNDVMKKLHLTWHVPCLGGQTEHYDLRCDLQKRLHDIAKKDLKNYQKDMGE